MGQWFGATGPWISVDLDHRGHQAAPGDGGLWAAVGSQEPKGRAGYSQDKGSDLPWQEYEESGGGPKVCQGQMEGGKEARRDLPTPRAAWLPRWVVLEGFVA